MKRLLPFFYLIFALLLANSGCKPAALNCNCEEQIADEAFAKLVEEDGITFSWANSTKIEHNIPYNIVFESLDEPTKTLRKSFVYRQNESPRYKVYYKDDADFFAQNSLFRIYIQKSCEEPIHHGKPITYNLATVPVQTTYSGGVSPCGGSINLLVDSTYSCNTAFISWNVLPSVTSNLVKVYDSNFNLVYQVQFAGATNMATIQTPAAGPGTYHINVLGTCGAGTVSSNIVTVVFSCAPGGGGSGGVVIIEDNLDAFWTKNQACILCGKPKAYYKLMDNVLPQGGKITLLPANLFSNCGAAITKFKVFLVPRTPGDSHYVTPTPIIRSGLNPEKYILGVCPPCPNGNRYDVYVFPWDCSS